MEMQFVCLLCEFECEYGVREVLCDSNIDN